MIRCVGIQVLDRAIQNQRDTYKQVVHFQPGTGSDSLIGGDMKPRQCNPLEIYKHPVEQMDEGDEGGGESASAPAVVAPAGDEERPGVGRKKAEELPDKGYHTADKTQKGCCGCVVM